MNQDAVERSTSHIGYVLLLTGVAALGGLLFGYDTAVINGANDLLREHFQIVDDALYGWVCSSALVGCIFGAMGAGFLGDHLGRRRSLLICAALFAVSAVGSAIPTSVSQFVIFRIIGGLGVGAASMLSPMYIAEIAPACWRGRLVSMNQLAIVVGILLAFFVNSFIQSAGSAWVVDGQAWNMARGWRWMFGAETAPAVVFFTMLCFVPDSPRFLMMRGRSTAAAAVLRRTVAPTQVQAQLDTIAESLGREQGTLGDLLRPGMKITLLIGVAMAVFQQWTGINAIMYYSTSIFKTAGFAEHTAFTSSIGVGAVNLVFTFMGIALVDRIGRKPLLIGGAVAQAAMLGIVAWAFVREAGGWWVLAAVLGFVGAFAASLGPVTWVVISEIFPTRTRGRAMSVATFFLWVACYSLSQTFPMLLGSLGAPGTFGLYAGLSVICAVFVAVMVPETRGLSLEEIEQRWASRMIHSTASTSVLHQSAKDPES
ncbi:sugar porter family MFS transporter [Planctomycetales bacterium ZRK34]|nr:sugar porter family MFS transporter [Planctomycetales bacterium ZRK34]